RWTNAGGDITQQQTWLGSPSYMAPEQAQNSARAGPASDIYSLGATLYDLLTGRPPFKAADAVETLRQVISEEPVPPRRLNRAIDRDLELVCLKCLSKEPAARYPSAAQLADELRHYLNREPLAFTRPVGKTTRVWRWSRRNPGLASASALAIVFLVTVVGVSVAFGLYRSEASERLAGAALETRRQSALWARDWGAGLCERGECNRGIL